MTERERIQRALEPLHASDRTLEEVFGMIDREKTVKHMKRTGRNTLRTILIAAAVAAALTVSAYAIGEYTGFFETVFGDENIASWDAEHVILTDSEGNVWKEYDAPGQERVAVDPDQAQELVGDETVNVSQSVTVQDVTFTVEDFVMDENGMGVLTYTMEDPNGFPGMEFTDESGILTQEPDLVGSQRVPNLTFADEDGKDILFLDSYDFVAAGGTDTKKTVVRYFAPFEGLEEAANLKLTFAVVKEHDQDATLFTDVVDQGGVIFPLSQAVAATPLSGPGGWSASVSPVGLKITPPEGNPYGDYSLDVVIHMADGTDYVLKQSEPYLYNITVECRGEDGATNYTFNRLIDPAQVESVTAVGHGSGFQDESGQPVPWEEAWSDDGNSLQEGLSELQDELDLTFTK